MPNDEAKRGASPMKGYMYVAIGILFLLGPMLSSTFYFFATTRNDKTINGTDNRSLYEYWNETRPFLRVLTVLPATIIVCICHWVSIRIYLRR